MIRTLKSLPAAFGALAVFAVLGASPGFALTAQECSAKYNAAKAALPAGAPKLKWNDFRKTECAATPAADTKTAAPAATEAKPVVKPAATTTPTSTTAVFPKAVDAKYAKETAGKARMHTCRDQYQANKATNGNGGMKWIADEKKTGNKGYYSACNTALKS